MDEYIKRQDAIDAMKRLPHEYKTKEQRARTGGIADCQMAVRGLPPADVKPVVRGTWEHRYSRPNVYADLFWHCSACGFKSMVSGANTYSYCPNCGADMRGGDAE